MSKKWLVGVALAASVALSACGSGPNAGNNASPGPDASAGAEASGGTEQPAMPELDLAGIPDVVANVNDAEISKDEFVGLYESQFQRLAMQSQMSGQKLDQDKLKTQTVEGMIGAELLSQEAADRKISASEADIAKALDELVKANQLKSPDEFIAAMEKQGMDKDEVTAQVERQVEIKALIIDEAGGTKASDEEINAAYEALKAQQEKTGSAGGGAAAVPPLEEVRSDLEARVVDQKEAQVAQTLVKNLRADAEVTIHL